MCACVSLFHSHFNVLEGNVYLSCNSCSLSAQFMVTYPPCLFETERLVYQDPGHLVFKPGWLIVSEPGPGPNRPCSASMELKF